MKVVLLASISLQAMSSSSMLDHDAEEMGLLVKEGSSSGVPPTLNISRMGGEHESLLSSGLPWDA